MQLDNKIIPWKSGSSPLVSLLDMIKFCAEEFCAFMGELDALFKEGIFSSSRTEFTSGELNRIMQIVDRASTWCKLIELNGAPRLINHIKTISTHWWIFPPVPGEFGENILALKNIIEDELHERLFMFLPKEQAQWYEKEDGFGVNVSDAFPSAIDDIKEAGNCYATGRYTACVFHLMRVLEHGIRVLATEVCLDFDQEQWHTIINQIRSVIKTGEEKLKRGSKKASRLKFLADAAIEFSFFKDAWRNHVSHGRAYCDRQEAKRVLDHVKSFMVHLSTQLSE